MIFRQHQFARKLFKVCSISLLLIISSCSSVKYLNKGEYLIHKVNIQLDADGKEQELKSIKEEIKRVNAQKANNKWFGLFKVNLWAYNIAGKGERGFKKWLKTKIGEPPSLLDTGFLEISSRKMETVLFNNGFFHPKVEYKVVSEGRKANITYDIYPKDRFSIGKVTPLESRSETAQLINTHLDEALIREGDYFNSKLIDQERGRLVEILQNNGYLDFNKDYLHFELDSFYSERKVDVYYYLKKNRDGGEHKKYKIKDVIVSLNSTSLEKSERQRPDTITNGHIKYMGLVKHFRPDALYEMIYLKRDEYYSLSYYKLMLNHLYGTGAFRFINPKFERTQVDSTDYLNIYLDMILGRKMQFTTELETTNRYRATFDRGFLGAAINTSFLNKNFFRGAEVLTLNLFSGVEFDLENPSRLINTIDISAQIDLRIPKFLAPLKITENIRKKRPSTHFNVTTNYVRRVDLYSVLGTEFRFGYDWRSTSKVRHLLDPFSVNFFRLLNKEPAFEEDLAGSVRLQKSFEERVIASGLYTFLFSNQAGNLDRTFSFFKADVELAGNSLYLAQTVANVISGKNGGNEVAGIRFANFLRLQADYRRYLPAGLKSSLVLRAYAGLGVPYGNSDFLPFTKEFFAGGTNDIRAFPIRSVGPGSFTAENEDQLEFERTGDVKLEVNAEWRFPIYSYFKGAVFLDAGNIWTLRKDSTRVGGEFNISRFYKEFAVGSGVGLRLDFSYFLIRFDMAFPLRVPYLAEGQRWVLKDIAPLRKQWRRDNLNLNLGIGFPF